MKKITLSFILIALMVLSSKIIAQDCGGYYYITSNAGWTDSEWYKIIDIDAATLTDATFPKFSAADGAKNAADSDFGSGTFGTTVYDYDDNSQTFVPTSLKWPVQYYLAAFAPTMYTSAYSKINILGTTPSGTGSTQACTYNDNSVKNSKIFNKPGFIELSRMGSLVLSTPPSRHGYIEIDDLPQVERIQWSYSSTSWKRGVKADINYNDGQGWKPLRWVASDYSAWEATFSEQGYQFEEMINKQDDPSSKISIRFRIWDGDSIHFKVNANDLSQQAVTYSSKMTPYDQKQTVRIHQIKVFAGAVPTSAPNVNGLKSTVNSKINVIVADNAVNLSESADYVIYSYDGKHLLAGKSNKIDVSKLNKGIYILKLSNENGQLQKKIVL